MKNRWLFICLLSLSACSRPQVVPPVTDISGLNLHGHGVAYLPDGSFYNGEFKDGLFNGNGTLVWNNGVNYVGEFRHGRMHGKGVMQSPGDFTYRGNFANGFFEGQGDFIRTGGYQYKGEFVHGDYEGQGRFVSDEGYVYEGEFQHGKPAGQIKVTYAKDASYTGGMQNWHFDGEGTYITKDVIYAGHFRQGILEGKGVIEREYGRYEGEVKNWMEHGSGVWHGTKGAEYTGEFVQGRFDGEGSYKNERGDVYLGEFKDGLYSGKGEMRYAKPNGHKKVIQGYWEYGDYIGRTKHPKKPKSVKPNYIIEDVLFNQPKLLDASLQKLKLHQPGNTDMYFVAFAPYGSQDVFMNEAKLSATLFDRNYHTAGRSLLLINNAKTLNRVPMATRHNLQASLDHIAGIMNKEEDILFLFLSGHGSKKHELSATLRGVQLTDLTAEDLKKTFAENKIKWKVLVVSACYSGGFIDVLKDPYTMIITAASRDHVSFGCSDEAKLTYFGRAFFKEALATSPRFSDAFVKARALVTEWENKEGYSNSNPTMYVGEKIEDKLAQWQHSRRLATR